MEDLSKKETHNFRSHKVKTYHHSTPTLKMSAETSLTDWNNVQLERAPPK